MPLTNKVNMFNSIERFACRLLLVDGIEWEDKMAKRVVFLH